jgi:hypothetical protein
VGPGDSTSLISEVDFLGRTVTCSRERWHTKIETDHPDLVGRHGDVALVIRQPHFVLQDRDYRDRLQHDRLLQSGLYLEVVVQYRNDPARQEVVGSITTAFRRRRPRADDIPMYMHVRRVDDDN